MTTDTIRCLTCDYTFTTDDQPARCPECDQVLMAEVMEPVTLIEVVEIEEALRRQS